MLLQWARPSSTMYSSICACPRLLNECRMLKPALAETAGDQSQDTMLFAVPLRPQFANCPAANHFGGLNIVWAALCAAGALPCAAAFRWAPALRACRRDGDSEEQRRDEREQRQQHGRAPPHVAEEAGHLDPSRLGNSKRRRLNMTARYRHICRRLSIGYLSAAARRACVIS